MNTYLMQLPLSFHKFNTKNTWWTQCNILLCGLYYNIISPIVKLVTCLTTPIFQLFLIQCDDGSVTCMQWMSRNMNDPLVDGDKTPHLLSHIFEAADEKTTRSLIVTWIEKNTEALRGVAADWLMMKNYNVADYNTFIGRRGSKFDELALVIFSMVTNMDVCILNADNTIWTTCPTRRQDDCDIFLLNRSGLNFDLVEIDENIERTDLYSEKNYAHIDDGDALRSDQMTEVMVVDASVEREEQMTEVQVVDTSVERDEQTTEVQVVDASVEREEQMTEVQVVDASVEREEQTTEVQVVDTSVERDEQTTEVLVVDARTF